MNKFTQLFIGTVIFIILFFRQNAGLNISIFALFVWLMTFLENKRKVKQPFFWVLSAATWWSCLSFAWYGDFLSFLSLLCSIIAVTFYAVYPRVKTVLIPVISFINFISFPFRFFYFSMWIPEFKGRKSLAKWIATGIIPGLFLILFSIVYATGSNTFSNFFTSFTTDLDFVQIALLGFLGFFILFNIRVLWIPRFLIKMNSSFHDDMNNKRNHSFFSGSLRIKSGVVTFILLNVLLIIFILTYNYEQFFEKTGSDNLSSQIHQRIFTIIASIVLAIATILFYFRTKINTSREERVLTKLAFMWIFLNVLLVTSAFIKNGEYIMTFGLTFKRISVFIFLILCLIGLFLTLIKIKYQKTDYFLIKRMMWVSFFTLVITAPVNFSWIVTKYNIITGKNEDNQYLKTLGYNKKILYNYYKKNPDWQSFFKAEQEVLRCENKKPVLSSNLYYTFLKLR